VASLHRDRPPSRRALERQSRLNAPVTTGVVTVVLRPEVLAVLAEACDPEGGEALAISRALLYDRQRRSGQVVPLLLTPWQHARLSKLAALEGQSVQAWLSAWVSDLLGDPEEGGEAGRTVSS